MLLGDSFLLIWDSRFSTQTEQGKIQIINLDTGQVVATEGDFVEVSKGGDLTNPTWLWLKRPLPKECLGPYYMVGQYFRTIEKP
jgi:hypothetical protein